MNRFLFDIAGNDNSVVYVAFRKKEDSYDCVRQEKINEFLELLIDYRDALYFPRTEKEHWQITYAFAERLTDMCEQ